MAQETEPAAEASGQEEAGPEETPARRRPWVKWTRRVVLTLVLVLLVPLLGAETALRVNYTGDPADGTYTRDKDAIWLGHA
ncbi:hypothetical protein GCM10010121_020100 [Streptomyces brasiliensis]|uniref:Uncharacterized protein n=1 Tax=Streptomyces brasiliensis TaxID=1954 RepID=A0A917KH35_9ACTN|nr:hypothetical protein GCM10010121_020100 [Streptomyces brasiliensis]